MYYTEKEVRELLEQAFAEGYDDGIDDTLDYIDENYELEDDSFDLEEEYDYYTEMTDDQKEFLRNGKVQKAVDTLVGDHPRRKKEVLKGAISAFRLQNGTSRDVNHSTNRVRDIHDYINNTTNYRVHRATERPSEKRLKNAADAVKAHKTIEKKLNKYGKSSFDKNAKMWRRDKGINIDRRE